MTGDRTADVPPDSARAAWRVPDFRNYLLAVFLLTLGVSMQTTALGAHIFDLTKEERALGFAGLAEALPSIGVVLFAGQLADRRDRRRILLFATAALGLCSIGFWRLAVVDQNPELATSLYAVIALTGLARGIMNPARTALGTDVVPRETLAAAVNLRTSVWQTAMCVGPPLGGFVYDFGGAATVYAFDAAVVFMALAAFARIRLRRAKAPPRTESTIESLKEGVRFVRDRKEILGAITLDLLAVLFGGATALLPKYAADIFEVDKAGLGWLRGAQSFGAVVMALALVRLPPFRRAGRTLLVSVAVFGVAWIAFAYCRSFPLALGILVVVGAADYVSVVVRHTLVQTRTPTEMLGRVSAVNSVFIGSSNEIGAFESGMTADWFGTERAVAIGGGATLLVAALVAKFCPTLRRLGPLK